METCTPKQPKQTTMTPEQKKAKEILIKYISIIGSECEHDSYCDRPECNKLGCIFCCVDYAKAKACAIEEVKAVIAVLPNKNHLDEWINNKELSLINYHETVLTEIEKL